MTKYNRTLRKLAHGDEMQGGAEHRTGAYSMVREDSSTAPTQQSTPGVEFPNGSIAGLIVGRFNVIHLGHQKLIDAAIKLCDKVLILVGSAQESNTERNPFSVETRIKAIQKIYGSRVIVAPLADLTNEYDISPEWGRYVMKHAKLHLGQQPEVIIYGDDAHRSGWFAPEDIKDTATIVVNRSDLPISATEARLYMVKDERDKWENLHDPALHTMYQELRAELLNCQFYQ